MRNLIALLVAAAVVVAVLVFFGFLDLSPAGEAALDQTREGVGRALETTGEAIRRD